MPLQLLDVYLFAAEVQRQVVEGLSDPAINVGEAIAEVSPDSPDTRFSVALGAEIAVSIHEKARLAITATVLGEFFSSVPLPQPFVLEFARREGLVLLWPYLRSELGQLASLTHVSVPILPTLDVRAARFATDAMNVFDGVIEGEGAGE